jgi:cytochrome oxidase assembly protein ShyY1
VTPLPATGRISVTGSGVAATLLLFVVAAACIRLGFWQLDRLAERRLRNDQLAARLAQPVVELQALSADTTGWLHRHVILRGQYDVERSIVLPARYLGGVPGVHVVTPLRLASGEAVLVNRGWLPAADGINADTAAFRHAGPVKLEVLARTGWRGRASRSGNGCPRRTGRRRCVSPTGIGWPRRISPGLVHHGRGSTARPVPVSAGRRAYRHATGRAR